jgi:hypothetical protein
MESHYSKDQVVTQQKPKWYQWAPSWLQVGMAIGSAFITIGIAYANIQDLKGRMTKVEANQIQQATLMVEVGQLHIQIEQANRTQQATNEAVIKLSDSVNLLGNAVSNLQGQLESRQKFKR